MRQPDERDAVIAEQRECIRRARERLELVLAWMRDRGLVGPDVMLENELREINATLERCGEC